MFLGIYKNKLIIYVIILKQAKVKEKRPKKNKRKWSKKRSKLNG